MNQATEIDLAKIYARKDWQARVNLRRIKDEAEAALLTLDNNAVPSHIRLSELAVRAEDALKAMDLLNEVNKVVAADEAAS